MNAGALRISPHVAIPLSEIELTFARAGGPGGQNVNKVASKVMLRLNLPQSPSLPDPLKQRLIARLATRLTRAGDLIITGGRFRDQARNRVDALERLRLLLASAARPPKRRVPTKPSPSAGERRLSEKKARARTKRLRAMPGDSD